MHKQIQIAPGVYVTDFRKNGQLTGLTEQRKQLTNDIGLLLDQVNECEQKIKHLIYSINQIKQQQNWQNDADFTQAIQDNWKCIVKFSYEMKQKVLRLFQLNYQPESQKIQELLQITRIQERQAIAIQQMKKYILKMNKELQQKKQLVKVQSSDQEQDRQNKNKKNKQNKQNKQEKQKQKNQEEDQGVFV